MMTEDIPSIIDSVILEERDYQINIYENVKDKDSLVVLPTGLGKTIIALYLIGDTLNENEKVLMMAPTRPLCEQHSQFIKDSIELGDEVVALITGELYFQDERKEIWNDDHLIYVATPQTVNNDLHLIPVEDFDLMIFDEAHRAVGEYPYVDIGRACKEKTQYLGLTATPAGSYEKMVEVCHNLGIDKIEVRTEENADVREYVGDRKLEVIEIEKDEVIMEIEKSLDSILQYFLKELSDYTKRARFIEAGSTSKKALVDLQGDIQQRMKKEGKKGYLFHALSLTSACIKTAHLKELLLTQGIDAANNYVLKLKEEDTRSSKYLKKRDGFDRVRDKLLDLKAMPICANKKMMEAKDILEDYNEEGNIIVFAQYRDTVENLAEEFSEVDGIKPAKLIGQADKGRGEGMTQKEQKEVLQKFKEGNYNVLISTRIGEEGLDIPDTDAVILYEPVPSAIRTIQRKGRTARDRKMGKVYVLISQETMDEAFYWKSTRQEKKVYEHANRLKDELEEVDVPQKYLERLMRERS